MKHSLKTLKPLHKVYLAIFVLVFAGLGTYLLWPSHATSIPRHAQGSFQINVDDGAGKTVNVAYDVTYLSNVPSGPAPAVIYTNAYAATWGYPNLLSGTAQAKYGFMRLGFRGLHGGTYFPGVTAVPSAGPMTCGPSGTSRCDDIPYVMTVLHDLLLCGTAAYPVNPATGMCSFGVDAYNPAANTVPYMNLDASKIYAVGDSTGGAMVEGIMCDTRTSSLVDAYIVSSALLLSQSTSGSQTALPNCPALGIDSKTNTADPTPRSTTNINKNLSVLWLYSSTGDICSATSGVPDCMGQGSLGAKGWAFGDDQLATTVLGYQLGTYPSTTPTASNTHCTIPVSNQSGGAQANGTFVYTVYGDTAGSNGQCSGTHRPVTATLNAGAGSWHMPDTNNNITPNPAYGYGGLNLGDVGWNFFTTYGMGGSTSTPPPPPPPSDTTPPTVSLSAPTGNTSVSGTVTVSANASDNVAVASVQFKLDGNNLGNADATSPYSYAWDTTSASNGNHTLTAIATDTSGNTTTSTTVTVSVNNTTGGSSGGTGSLLWNGDFETGNLSQYAAWQGCWTGNGGDHTAVNVITNPVRSGSYAVQQTVNTTDPTNCPNGTGGHNNNPNNPASTVYTKSLFGMKDATYPNATDDAYIGFSVYFPSSFPDNICLPYNKAYPSCWFQFMEVYGAPFGGSPPLGFNVRGNTMTFNSALPIVGANGGGGDLWASPTIQKNTWQDFVLHVKFSTDPTVGYVELWYNGAPQPLFNNGSQSPQNPYRDYYATLKPGVTCNSPCTGAVNYISFDNYRGPQTYSGITTTSSTPIASATIYHDQAKVGTSCGSVDPTGTNCGQTTSPPPPDTTPPTVQLTAPASNATLTGTTTLSANATDNVAVAKVQFQLDGSNVGSADTTAPYSTSWDSTAISNGSHVVTAVATDTSGNTASNSVTVNVNNTVVVTPPGVPQALHTAAASSSPVGTTGSSVSLAWTASTAGTNPIAGYYIVRNGVTIGQTSATIYIDSTVSASQTYSYQVMAYDTLNQTSGLSNTISVTIPAAPDTQSPTVPTNLTAQSVSTSQINLSWTASTDNVGVTGYDIYRNGQKIATVTTTSFGNTGLSAATSYSYYVIARDAAGNSSPASNTASATTQTAVKVTTGTVAGTVRGINNAVLSGVQASIVYNNATHYYTTNSLGHYAAADVPTGSRTVRFSKSGYQVLNKTITVNSNQTTTVNVTLSKVTTGG